MEKLDEAIEVTVSSVTKAMHIRYEGMAFYIKDAVLVKGALAYLDQFQGAAPFPGLAKYRMSRVQLLEVIEDLNLLPDDILWMPLQAWTGYYGNETLTLFLQESNGIFRIYGNRTANCHLIGWEPEQAKTFLKTIGNNLTRYLKRKTKHGNHIEI